jgi:hypothetical protein
MSRRHRHPFGEGLQLVFIVLLIILHQLTVEGVKSLRTKKRSRPNNGFQRRTSGRPPTKKMAPDSFAKKTPPFHRPFAPSFTKRARCPFYRLRATIRRTVCASTRSGAHRGCLAYSADSRPDGFTVLYTLVLR